MQRLFRASALVLGMAVPAALAAGLGGFALPAGAQQVVPAVSSEDAATCLCLERALPGLRAEMELRRGIMQEREGELERLGMDIEVKRAAMTPGDDAAMGELKALIARQQSLRALIRRDIVPSYQGSIAELNAAIAIYNERCAGKRIEQADIDRLSGQLQCPAKY